MPQIRGLTTLKVQSNINSMKVILQITSSGRAQMYSRKGVGQKNGTLRNTRINWIFLWRLPVQNHSKPSITEKRRNKAIHLTWNSTRLKFVKKTGLSNPVKSLGYIKYYSSNRPRPVKSLSNSTRYNYQKICSWSRRPKAILEIRKKGLISLGDQQS